MDRIAGFARTVSVVRVMEQSQRSLWGLGKRYVLLGRLQTVAGYLFMSGGMLGRKYTCDLDAFGHAYLGAVGEPGAVEELFGELTDEVVLPHLRTSTNVFTYVSTKLMTQMGFSGEVVDFFMKTAQQRLRMQQAIDVAWDFAVDGAALGALYPEMFVSLLERTYAKLPDEKWEQARQAGLDISEKQVDFNYSEVEEAEASFFVAYCRQCCPQDLIKLVPRDQATTGTR